MQHCMNFKPTPKKTYDRRGKYWTGKEDQSLQDAFDLFCELVSEKTGRTAFAIKLRIQKRDYNGRFRV